MQPVPRSQDRGNDEQYAAFIAPFLGMLLGFALARIAEHRSARVAIAVAMAGAVVLLASEVVVVSIETAPDLASTVDAIVPPGAQHLWTVAIGHADYLVTNILFAEWYIPPDPALRTYVATNFRLIQSGGLLVDVRNGFPAG